MKNTLMTIIFTAIIVAGGMYVFQRYSISKKTVGVNPTPTQAVPMVSVTIAPSVEISVTPSPKVQTGSISGTYIYPSEHIPTSMRACAEDINGGTPTCSMRIKEVNPISNTFIIKNIPAGMYYVYSEIQEGATKAYYDEFVTCGLQYGCPSHKKIAVEVKAGEETKDIKPHDWYNQ